MIIVGGFCSVMDSNLIIMIAMGLIIEIRYGEAGGMFCEIPQ